MTPSLLVLVVIIVILVGGLLPTWPYSASWGYGPSGIVLVLAIVLLLWMFWGGGRL